MNTFYKSKVSLPREVKNADGLRSALKSWKEKRLLHVVKACEGSEDLFRVNYAKIHKEYADDIENILACTGKEKEKCDNLLIDMKVRFNTGSLAAMPGWLKGASGICGAELEEILNIFTQQGSNEK